MRNTKKGLRLKVLHLQSKGHDIDCEIFNGKFRITNKGGSTNFTVLGNIAMCLAWLDGYMHAKHTLVDNVVPDAVQFGPK